MIHCGTLSSLPCQMLTAATDSCWPRGCGAAAFLILSQLNQCLNYGSKSKWKKTKKKTPKRLLTSRLLCCSKQSGLNVLGAKLFALRFLVSENQTLMICVFIEAEHLPWRQPGSSMVLLLLRTLRLEAVLTLILVTSSITLQDQTSHVKHNSLINHRCSPLDLSRGLFDHSVVFHIQISVKLKLHFTRRAGRVFNMSH